MQKTTTGYFERFGFCEQQIAAAADPNLQIVVVIPCFNEPDLLDSLRSLHQCERPRCAIEVIVVINSAADANEEICKRNQLTYGEALAWSREHSEERMRFHILHCPALPPRHAGVGLARKIGMDEALRRLAAAGTLDRGIISGFDADSTCGANYFVALESHFEKFPVTPGCSIYFEHPLEGPEQSEVYEAAAAYELHLRYYIEALRYAGSPHAFHTIGSSMAVRAGVYMAQGGMNRRQAGEDFYFLHKVIPLGGFTELTATTVYPSPRASDRVPFGTGKAVGDQLRNGRPFVTYPLNAFRDLRAFLEAIRTGGKIPDAVSTFLEEQRFDEVLAEIRRNTSTVTAFEKRFFRWFDGFMAVKMIHYLRDRCYGEPPLRPEAERLVIVIDSTTSSGSSIGELLGSYRKRQRKHLAA